MLKVIKLVLINGRALVGEEYGEFIFDRNIKNELEIGKDLEIIFPEEIKAISISFINGFIKNINYKFLIERVTFKGHRNVVRKINSVI